MTKPFRKPPSSPDVDPTQLQRAASDPKTSAWVNASAGSGKTTVLTNRVTRLLLSGVPPQRILCLTFTRAAAAEMSNRVTKQLAAWATCSEDQLRYDLDELQNVEPSPDQLIQARRLFARVLGCPGGMRIRTIHAFCQEILRRFPIEAGLPPHFGLIEEDDARALQEDVLRDLLRVASNDADNALGRALKSLVLDLGEKGFNDAMRSLLSERAQLTAALNKAGSLEKLIARIRSALSLEPGDTTENIIADTVTDKTLPRADLSKAAKALLQGGKTAQQRGKAILEFLELGPKRRAALFDDYRGWFFTEKGDPYQKFADKKSLAIMPDADAILSIEATRLRSVLERLEIVQQAENTASLLTFGAELLRQYETHKAANAALDYDDLVIRADTLLRRTGIAPWVLFKLDGGLDHILVDEAQDTSRAQWRIVQALSDEFFAGSGSHSKDNRTLFVVGDEKQSIFSFQHADPKAFSDMRDYFAQRIREADKKYYEVPMNISFRSAPAILNAIDHVFASPAMREGVSVEPVSHRAFDRDKIGRVEVWPLQPAPKKEAEEQGAWPLPLGYEAEQDPQAELAQHIAGKIKSWLNHNEMLEGANRPINAGDIMILLRRRGRFADLMVRSLKQRGVPVTGVDRMCLVKQLPVMDLLALVQFMLLPEDDLNLATVLRGPLLNLSEDDLMELAIGRKDGLWQALSEKAAKNKAFSGAHDYLSRWLNIADFTPPFDLLVRILNEACPGSTVSGRHAIWSRLGPDALDPIDELLSTAQSFGQRHTPSLQTFLHWLSATEAEIKRELDRGLGQVRIMTVHASKGLEAPIVFLPDTATLPRVQDMPKILWSNDGVPLYVARKPKAGAGRRMWEAARQRQMEEYRRLMYVALTRAINRLYIVGWEPLKKEGATEDSWYSLAHTALKPLHEPAAVMKDVPEPLIAFADPVLRPAVKTKLQKETAPEKITLPAWARTKAPEESVPVKPLSPSRLALPTAAASPDILFRRGRITHRLLQSLPDVPDDKRDAVASRFLKHPQHLLTPPQQDDVKNEVLKLLRHPDYAALFGSGSKAEVPLAGRIGNVFISGQVDRLLVRDDEVWIVDYKTNRPPPKFEADVPHAYRQQLAEYRAILRGVYPQHTIRCFLLWTYGAALMELPDAVLPAV